MELVLSSPSDCVVLQWLVAAGDAVAEGQVHCAPALWHASAFVTNVLSASPCRCSRVCSLWPAPWTKLSKRLLLLLQQQTSSTKRRNVPFACRSSGAGAHPCRRLLRSV